MHRQTSLLVGALLAALVVAAPAAAHFGGDPLVHVPLDHITPGRSFPVIGADLGPGAKVVLKLLRDGRATSLRTLRAHSDGHFTTKALVPEGFPDGYARLVAISSTGATASTWVLVGARAESVPSGSSGGDGLGIGTALIPVAGLILVGLGVAGMIRMRATRRRRGSVSA